MTKGGHAVMNPASGPDYPRVRAMERVGVCDRVHRSSLGW